MALLDRDRWRARRDTAIGLGALARTRRDPRTQLMTYCIPPDIDVFGGLPRVRQARLAEAAVRVLAWCPGRAGRSL